MGPGEDSFCRICSPIARLWGKKTVKNGPLRPICSRRFPSPTGSSRPHNARCTLLRPIPKRILPMPTLHTAPSCPGLHRRTALLGAVGLLVLPAPPLRAATPPQAWPRALAVPGGVARLPLGPGAVRPAAHLRQGEHDVPLLVVGDAQEWTALVGLALATAPGPAHITVRAADGGTRTVAFTVAPKRYKEQRLQVAPGTVDLSPEDQARFERERAHQAQVMATFSTAPGGALKRWPCRCRCRGGAPARSGCGACSMARRAIRTAAWTLPPPRARPVAAAAGAGDRCGRLFFQRQHRVAGPRPAACSPCIAT
jgi:hypothetical protein